MMLQITPRVVEGGSLVAGADATMVTAIEKATRPIGAATQMPQRTPKAWNAATGADATTTTAIGRATRPVKAKKTQGGGKRRPQRPAAGRSQTRRSSTGAFSPKAF